MVDEVPPITISELVKLTDLDVTPDQITWSRVTMTSDKWICIRHDRGGKQSASKSRKEKGDSKSIQYFATVFTPFANQNPQTWSVRAESMLMNPQLPILALKAKKKVEVFNVESRSLLRTAELANDISFWTWATADVIALVTESAVYHWSLHSDLKDPELVFMRHSRLNYSEIISYKTDSSLKWCALTGLLPEDTSICGVTQLFSKENGISQCIPAHAVSFTRYKFDWNIFPSTVMCVASRDAQYGKFHVVELGPHNPSNMALTSPCDVIQYPDLSDKYDFPVQIHASSDLGLVYVTSKYGRLFICDLETSCYLGAIPISTDVVFASALNTQTQGLISITTDGRVLCTDVKKEALVNYVRDVARKPFVAARLEKTLAKL
ncbi:clathrin heavy chain 2-like [Tubulanus polymorphus]|uniref:clathrin heavy chain 2-like n=1 Tax=Tubulanus polymorphus TaxID=672921 RepID=UPI003DA6B61F